MVIFLAEKKNIYLFPDLDFLLSDGSNFVSDESQ
jgi:hypothetical protein